jgi:hypothetical protein
MSCAGTTYTALDGDAAGDVLSTAMSEVQKIIRDIETCMSLFEVKYTSLRASTTIPSVEACFVEAAAQLDTAYDKMKELYFYFLDIDVDKLITLARQSDRFRGMTDEQVAATVKSCVKYGKQYWAYANHRFNTEVRFVAMSRTMSKKKQIIRGEAGAGLVERIEGAPRVLRMQRETRKGFARDGKFRRATVYGRRNTC